MIEGVPFLDLPRQHRQLRRELDEAIGRVLDRADFIKGAAVGDFEASFAAYQQARHCIAVGNGTDALEIAIAALDLPSNSEIIVPANSFVATSEAVTSAGHRVVFADVDSTYTLDLADVEARITEQTAAVVAVHLYGQPADLAPLLDLCHRHGLRLIEDAAQAHGAEYNGRKVGAIGDVGTFSFFPGKNLGAIGDAGAILTDDADLAARCRQIADHGRVGKYDHEREGRNSRMDTIQAAVLGIKLAHLDGWLAIRRQTADIYRHLLRPASIALQESRSVDSWLGTCLPGEVKMSGTVPGTTHAYHLFVVRVADRQRVRDRLGARGIATGVHYPVLLPRLVAYATHPQHSAEFACAPWSDELLSLPVGDHMDPSATRYVAESLLEALHPGPE
jgi:dTDP-4-amino-4,6-dideoxygalactose transaminase